MTIAQREFINEVKWRGVFIALGLLVGWAMTIMGYSDGLRDATALVLGSVTFTIIIWAFRLLRLERELQ